ncbi:hypothetical protein OS493_014778 [Desmophyllum pertusum]|uniref:Uncharacterized protein n=1 Tax=Desmophyllum pertusum TaxID=174260 RepID=A0A9X0CH79_9CNID|nr:hypothetical protein OS493_014778 [Desmophyllum pertusum]
MQSSSNSESSLRRSLIQEELEELASRPKRQSPHEEEEGEEEEIVEEEHECQLEFDDVFPAHREGDEEEAQVDDDIFDDEGEDEDESLVSVSDAEDFTDYDTRPEGLQDYEFEDNVCVTHEFMEEEPSPMEIFDVYDEDVSHQYADVTEEEDQPQSSTKNVFIPTNMSTATEFQKTENFKLCEDEPPDVMEHAPDSYSEERVETTEAVVEVTQTSFQRTLDPESCYMVTKQEDARMKELISKIGLLPVEDDEGASDDLSDFNETMEGKLLEDVINSRNDRELQDERTPIDEICEAFLRDNVESEIDFDALFERLEREATETEKENAIPETSTEPARTESPETVQVVLRDHQSERTAGMEQIGVDLELVSVDQLPAAELEKEQELEPDITLDYECKTSTPVDGESFIELVSENTIEAVRRDRLPESEMDVKELQIRVESPTGKEESQEEIPQDTIDASREEQSCEAVLRDYDHERARVLEETGLQLVPVSSNITHPLEEPVAEPLEYDLAPKSSTVRELPDVAEHINAEARRDVQSEINFEDMFRRLDEEDAQFADEATETDETQEEITQDAFREEQSCEAVLRDYDHERVRVLEETGLELNLVPISSDITHPFEEPVAEPLEYDQVAKSSTLSELPEVSEYINADVRRDVQSEINFEEMFRRLDEEDTTFADEATETDETHEEITQDKIDAFREEQSCEAVLRDYDQERVRILEETGLELVPVSSGITHYFEESVAEPLEYDLAPKSSTVSELPEVAEVAENINAEVRRDVQSEINFEEMFRRLDEEDTTFADEATETQRLEETVKETSSNEETSRASLYVEEDGTVDEVVHCIPSSSKYISHESKQSEPTEEIIHEIKQAKARPASLYIEENKLVEQVAAETPSSPKHIAGESVNVERIEVVSEVKETREEKRASLIVDELHLVKEIDTEAPYSQHVAGEGDNTEPFEEITEETLSDHEMRASLYMEEDIVVQEVTPEAPSSPRHLANECENIHPSDEDIEEIEQSVEEKRASLYMEEETTVDYVTTDTPSSPLHIAGESSNSESVEEIYEQEFDEVEKPASLFVEEDSIVNEVAPDTPSSPKHIAGESQNVEPFEEIDEEPTEERKRTSLFLEEDSLVDEVETDTPSSPKHIAGESQNVGPFEEVDEEPTEESKRASLESRNVEPFEEVDEEATEESKRASLFLEEDSLVDEVETDTPSSPKHIAGESQNVEPFEEVDEEPTEESKRASLFLEEDSLVDEIETDTPSSPKHIAGESRNVEPFEEVDEEATEERESQNVEPFEEVDEEPTEESKRASLFLEEDSLVDEVETDTPSSPKHIAGESRNVEPFEEVDEEPTEESKRASLFLEEDSLVDEVETDTPSSPKHIVGESRNVEPFEEVDEEPTEESKRASLFLEEDSLVDEVETDTPSSPKHIAGESLNHEPFEEIVEEPTEESKRASLFLEEDLLVDEVETDTPSSPKHIAGESQNVEPLKKECLNHEPFEEIVEEPTEESKRASLFLEEDSLVDEVETDTPSSPKHIAGESQNVEPFEEVDEEPIEESKRASLFLEEDSLVDEIESDTPSSPKHITGESLNHEPFEEIVEEPTEESKRASLFLEEDSFVDEVETDTPSSPKHIAGESQNEENFEQTDEEPTEESKRAVLFLDEDTLVDEVITDTPSSPKHIAGESRNHESFEEIVEEPTEESKRASLFLEEDILVDEVITDIPSSPKHLAGESVNTESFQEVVEEPNDENKRASLFLEEDSSAYEVKTATSSVPIHIAGEALSITAVEEIHEEATPDVEHAREFEESDDEVRYDYVSLENADQNNYVAGEITNSELLEVTDDDESPESDYGEQFEEFEGIYGTQRFTEPSQSAHIAGEIKNIDSHDEAMEEVWKVEESLEYEDSQEVVTTTDIYETSQPSFHVAGELSNIEPQEESSEEEKPEEEACAEEFEEAEVQATTVVLKSPQSLLSIAAAALELKIDAAQQEVTEVVETKTVIEQQYSEGEHAGVPVILVNIAGDISDSDEDNTYYVEEEPQDDHEIETERYEENEETVVSYPSEEQLVSQSHVAAEFAVSEFTLEIEDQRYFAEPFEESEEGSVSELMSECSSSPLHVSGELRDFQDYETIDEEYGSETYHAIPYEESDYVLERPVSKGLPSLYITEEFSPQEIYEENILNETSVMIETAHAYNEVEEPLETEKTLVISEPPLQTAAEFSDSDYNDGIEEDDDLSERDFWKNLKTWEGFSGPQIAEEEDELSDEIDNAQTQDVWEIELEEGSQIVEAIEEKEFASEIHKFTVVSEKEQRVEIKSSYQVVESKETQHDERIFMTEQATQMEISHELEVLATKTTRQVSSVNSHVATEFASEEIRYKAEKNGAGGILHEEVKIIQEVSFTPIRQTSRHFETTDQLSESILEKEVKDQESEKFEKQLSEDETEVRLLKSEVMKYKAAEQQAPLENPHVTVERETTFVKSYIVHSATKDVQEIQEVLRQDDVLVILKDDEASLEEEESAGEQFEEEIDIMRIDEALSEEEFRGEGAVEEVDQRDKEEESEIREGDQETPLYEEEVEISEVQPIYEEELEIQKVEEQEEETSSETKDSTVQTPTFEEEVEVVAYGCISEAVKETLECEPVETSTLRAHSPEFEEELEVSAFEVQEEHAEEEEEEEPSGHSAVFEEENFLNNMSRKKVLYTWKQTTQRQPLDLSQVDLYEEDESATTRYYVELSSTESLEPAYEEVEDEALYTETYVRQGDPLEENLEEFILVRYGDEFDSSGEEDISDHREIYVIPEEENDTENNNVVESATDNLKAEKEPLPESFFEEGFENMGLEEIRESPEFEIDDSPEDELDEEEQRQLEEYERLESFVILEEKLSQVESDDDENGGFQGEEGDENVFHSDVHSSSEETLHEDELGETMTASSIRQAAVSTETESKEEERADDQISSEGKEEQKAQEDIAQRVNEEPLQTLSKRSDISSDKGSEKGEEPEEPPEAPPEGKVYPESRDKKDEKTEQSLSSDSSGEQSVSSEGSLSSTLS